MNLFPHNVKLISTSRFLEGGSSQGSFDNFNLAFHAHDKSKHVLANRILLASHYNLPSSPVWINQIHSNICVDAELISSVVSADASYTREPGVVCAVLTADCLPIFVSNKKGTVVGVAHAGWKGLVGGVIESLLTSFGLDKNDLVAHLGPAISQISFEVGEEVKSQYLSKNINFESCFTELNEKYNLDLYSAARVVLKSCGITSITGGDRCTYDEPDQYFSYRRDGAKSGRMAHLIWIKPD